MLQRDWKAHLVCNCLLTIELTINSPPTWLLVPRPLEPVENMGTDVVLFSSRKRTKTSSQQQMVGEQQHRKSAKHDVLTSAHAHDVHEDDVDNAPATSFSGLGLNQWLLSVLASLDIKQPTRMSWWCMLCMCMRNNAAIMIRDHHHTAVQAACIPHILRGRNVIGVAHTGSGKTAAFALPILQALAADRYGVFCLVMTPTRYGDFWYGEDVIMSIGVYRVGHTRM